MNDWYFYDIKNVSDRNFSQIWYEIVRLAIQINPFPTQHNTSVRAFEELSPFWVMSSWALFDVVCRVNFKRLFNFYNNEHWENTKKLWSGLLPFIMWPTRYFMETFTKMGEIPTKNSKKVKSNAKYMKILNHSQIIYSCFKNSRKNVFMF